MAIKVKVLYFGQAREAAGAADEEIELPRGSSVRMLVDKALEAHEGLRRVTRFMRVAVNQEIAGKDKRLYDGDTVAFLPPVAGG